MPCDRIEITMYDNVVDIRRMLFARNVEDKWNEGKIMNKFKLIVKYRKGITLTGTWISFNFICSFPFSVFYLSFAFFFVVVVCFLLSPYLFFPKSISFSHHHLKQNKQNSACTNEVIVLPIIYSNFKVSTVVVVLVFHSHFQNISYFPYFLNIMGTRRRTGHIWEEVKIKNKRKANKMCISTHIFHCGLLLHRTLSRNTHFIAQTHFWLSIFFNSKCNDVAA